MVRKVVASVDFLLGCSLVSAFEFESRTVRKLEGRSTTWNAGPCVLNPRDARRQNAGRHGALTG